MARTELPWLLMGRLIRPYALAVSVAAAMLGVAIFSDAIPTSLPGTLVTAAPA